MSEVVEYQHGEPFPGVIGRTVSESSPAWPKPVRAAEGAPNVLWLVLDDVGYGQLSSFGGLVNTPNIDRVAATASATRTCTRRRSARPRAPASWPARNHHSNGVPASRRPRPGTRATTAGCRSSTGCSPRCSSSTATTRSASVSGTWPRPRRRRRPGRITAGREGRRLRDPVDGADQGDVEGAQDAARVRDGTRRVRRIPTDSATAAPDPDPDPGPIPPEHRPTKQQLHKLRTLFAQLAAAEPDTNWPAEARRIVGVPNRRSPRRSRWGSSGSSRRGSRRSSLGSRHERP